MEKEKYEPSQEEIEKAEEMAVEGEMTPEQEKMSEERRKKNDDLDEKKQKKQREATREKIQELQLIEGDGISIFVPKTHEHKIYLGLPDMNSGWFTGEFIRVNRENLIIRQKYDNIDTEISLTDITEIRKGIRERLIPYNPPSPNNPFA